MLKSKFSLSRHFEYANEQITYHFWLNRNYSAILATLHYLQGSENGRVDTIEPEMIGDLLICLFKMAAQREFEF
jgi:hypothetical protein